MKQILRAAALLAALASSPVLSGEIVDDFNDGDLGSWQPVSGV